MNMVPREYLFFFIQRPPANLGQTETEDLEPTGTRVWDLFRLILHADVGHSERENLEHNYIPDASNTPSIFKYKML
jgi:hypothetical protein